MKKLLLKLTLYPLLGLLATALFIYLLLPTDTLNRMVTQRAENALDGKYTIDIADLSISPFGSITLQKIKLTPRPSTESDSVDLSARIEADRRAPDAAQETDGAPKGPIHHDDRCPLDLSEAARLAVRPSFIKQLTISPSLFQLLGGGLDAPFSLQIASGAANLRVVHLAERGTSITGALNGVQLDQLPLLSQLIRDKLPGLKLRGLAANFGADVDVQIAPKSGAIEGTINLRIQDLALCLPELQLGKNTPAVPLPDLRLGDLNGEIKMGADKRLSFSDLKAEGDDGALEVLGDIELSNPPRRAKSRYNLTLRFRFSDAYIQAGDLGMLDQICPAGPDGFREFILRGVEGEPGVGLKCASAKSARGASSPPLPPRSQSSPPPKPAPEPEPDPIRTADLPSDPDLPPDADLLPEPDYLPPPSAAAPTNPSLLKQRNLAPGGLVSGSTPVQRRQVLDAVKGQHTTPTDPKKLRRAIDNGKVNPADLNISDRQERFRGNTD